MFLGGGEGAVHRFGLAAPDADRGGGFDRLQRLSSAHGTVIDKALAEGGIAGHHGIEGRRAVLRFGFGGAVDQKHVLHSSLHLEILRFVIQGRRQFADFDIGHKIFREKFPAWPRALPLPARIAYEAGQT
jgi:hypothetical protein